SLIESVMNSILTILRRVVLSRGGHPLRRAWCPQQRQRNGERFPKVIPDTDSTDSDSLDRLARAWRSAVRCSRWTGSEGRVPHRGLLGCLWGGADDPSLVCCVAPRFRGGHASNLSNSAGATPSPLAMRQMFSRLTLRSPRSMLPK